MPVTNVSIRLELRPCLTSITTICTRIRNIPVIHVVIRHQVKERSEYINRGSMKERSTSAGNVNTQQLQRVVSLGTKQQYMKERNIPVTHAIIRHVQEDTSILINNQNIRERKSL